MTLVWENSSASGTELLLMLAIADFANDDGEAYPGITRLSRKCRVSKSSVQRAIKSCIENGELSVYYNNGIETGHGKTNLYEIHSERLGRGVKLTPVASVLPQGVSPTLPQGVSHVTPKPSEETSGEPSGGQPQNFDYLTHVATHQPGQETKVEPSEFDKHFGGYRDEVLNLYHREFGLTPNQGRKQALIDLANINGFDIVTFEDYVHQYNLSGGNPHDLDRFASSYWRYLKGEAIKDAMYPDKKNSTAVGKNSPYYESGWEKNIVITPDGKRKLVIS